MWSNGGWGREKIHSEGIEGKKNRARWLRAEKREEREQRAFYILVEMQSAHLDSQNDSSESHVQSISRWLTTLSISVSRLHVCTYYICIRRRIETTETCRLNQEHGISIPVKYIIENTTITKKAYSWKLRRKPSERERCAHDFDSYCFFCNIHRTSATWRENKRYNYWDFTVKWLEFHCETQSFST